MKLTELRNRVRTGKRFASARKSMRTDIAFQVSHMLEELRLSLNLSQSQFAQMTGLTQPAVARLERGSVVASIPMLQRIADAVQCDLLLPAFVSRRTGKPNTDSSTASVVSAASVLSGYYQPATRQPSSSSEDIVHSFN